MRACEIGKGISGSGPCSQNCGTITCGSDFGFENKEPIWLVPDFRGRYT